MRFYMTDDIQLRLPLLERMNCDWSLATIAALQISCEFIMLYGEVAATDCSAMSFLRCRVDRQPFSIILPTRRPITCVMPRANFQNNAPKAAYIQVRHVNAS